MAFLILVSFHEGAILAADNLADLSDPFHLRALVGSTPHEMEDDLLSVAAVDRGWGLEGGVGHVGRNHR
ncbi:hypothetical protein QUC32_09500 [Novosphingobium resinovorum]|uniref:hypothetical protein n=1 Tax=Novosphingobium TaxID=165696 RepID=UPI001B3C9C95|nr:MULTISPECIES: hypothetical protein [Novosphingobium]MBF7014159.1 hypothetical protein [Novosphingobium sp. HR1a]WJM25364.1 hypothetical protein QUC32_09500 [Novosphingobium resinovorum]